MRIPKNSIIWESVNLQHNLWIQFICILKNMELVCLCLLMLFVLKQKERLCLAMQPQLKCWTNSFLADTQRQQEAALSTPAFLLFRLLKVWTHFFPFLNSRKVKDYCLEMSAQGQYLNLLLSSLHLLAWWRSFQTFPQKISFSLYLSWPYLATFNIFNKFISNEKSGHCFQLSAINKY